MTGPLIAGARPRLASLPESPEVGWLFLDLNAYFASVEQQERPELRGRPVAVVPMITRNTCCIAASYEAKAFGVKTGVSLADARKLCPKIELVAGQPRLYVEYHHRILAAVEQCLPVDSVLSIDEMACRLLGRERQVENARRLARAVKAALRQVGETLRCSVGLAPNRFLAKVASDMQKPDGLTVLLARDLPQALFALAPGDLPGIGPRMQQRLARAGITTMPQMAALSPGAMRGLWGSVLGERMWHWMRGADFHDPEPPRKSLGKQHVLAPEFRPFAAAWPVALKMLHMAAGELRQLGLWARGLGLGCEFLGGPPPAFWQDQCRFLPCRNEFTLQAHLRRLWARCPPRPLILISVYFDRLAAEGERTLPLFEAADDRRDRASAAMDALNRKFGPQTVYPAGLYPARDSAPVRIPFRTIPRLDRFKAQTG